METTATSFQFPELPDILKPFHEKIFGFLNKPMVLAIPQDTLAVLPWQSKIGGYPYLPKGVSNPLLDKYEDTYYHKYMLLLQLNLQEISHLPDFPTKGILQFFATGEPEDCDDGKGDTKIIYYPESLENIDALETDFSNLPPKMYTPYFGFLDTPDEGVAINFLPMAFSLTDSGYQFNSDIETLFDDVDEELWEFVQDTFSAYLEIELKESYRAWLKMQSFKIPSRVIQIGGNVYQFFSRDRREIDNDGVVYDQLLMEYVCTEEDTKYGLPLKGYDAVPQFFINSRNLKAQEFSDYLYNCMF